MTDDLISRQAATDALNKLDVSDGVGISSIGCSVQESAISAVQHLPSAKPERKKGKWIVDVLADNIYRCSECGVDAPVEPTGGTEYKSNYCPHCGAKMEGSGE